MSGERGDCGRANETCSPVSVGDFGLSSRDWCSCPDPDMLKLRCAGVCTSAITTALLSRLPQRLDIQERDRRALWVLAVQFLRNDQRDMRRVHLG